MYALTKAKVGAAICGSSIVERKRNTDQKRKKNDETKRKREKEMLGIRDWGGAQGSSFIPSPFNLDPPL